MTPELSYDDESHEYRQNGVVVPSVTRIVNLVSPMPYIPPADLEWLRSRGKAVHTATELLEEGDLWWDGLDDRIRPFVEAWQRFLEQTGFRTVARETRVDHFKLGYAGRFDRIGYFPKQPTRLAIVDIKSGEVTIGAGVQTAGYVMAWNSGRHNPQLASACEIDGCLCDVPFIRDRYAVRLTEEGEAKLHALTNPLDFRAFEAGLVIHRWKESQ